MRHLAEQLIYNRAPKTLRSVSQKMYNSKLATYDLVLGSSSERRLQILKETLNISQVRQIKPNFEENLSKTLTPDVYVYQTCQHKLQAIIDEYKFDNPTVIICCDTIIDFQGNILEKPGNRQKQMEMLLEYKRYPELKVISSVQIAKLDVDSNIKVLTATVTSDLKFDVNISDEIIQTYCDSGEGVNVAGGFKYQGLGNVLFESLQGDYFNVVGLPAKATFELLNKLVK